MNHNRKTSDIVNNIMKKVSPIIRTAINESEYSISKDNVKDWYIQKYPTDNMGKDINSELSFSALWKYMKMGVDVYVLIAVGDSIIRERIFEELSRRLHVDYNEIYKTWLYKRVDLRKEDYIINENQIYLTEEVDMGQIISSSEREEQAKSRIERSEKNKEIDKELRKLRLRLVDLDDEKDTEAISEIQNKIRELKKKAGYC